MPSSYAAAPISLSQNGRREKREKRREKTIDHPRVSLGEPTNKKKKGRKMKRRTKQNERRQRGTHASKRKKKKKIRSWATAVTQASQPAAAAAMFP
jgi:hypothetical protein